MNKAEKAKLDERFEKESRPTDELVKSLTKVRVEVETWLNNIKLLEEDIKKKNGKK